MMSEFKNVIIIGASIAGHVLANRLAMTLPGTHRILLVDMFDFAYWPIAAMRAAVVPGWETKITVPLTTEHVFPAGSQHCVIAPNKVMELRHNSVILQHPFEGSRELTFWRCVVATGCAQPPPMRPAETWTQDDFYAAFRAVQSGIAKANKILIVGGGPVGVEMAGDIRHQHPEKEITIVHKDVGLLGPTPTSTDPLTAAHTTVSTYNAPPTHPRLSKRLGEIATQELNINVILEDRVVVPAAGSDVNEGDWDGKPGWLDEEKNVTLRSGRRVTADYVFMSTGNQPNVELVRRVDPTALSGRFVAVDEYMRVAPKERSSPLAEGYYAAGDVTNFPGRKVGYFASAQAEAVAKNIMQEIKGKPLIKHSVSAPDAQSILLDPENGAAAVTIPYLGTWVMGSTLLKYAKGRTLGLDRQWKMLWKGEKRVEVHL